MTYFCLYVCYCCCFSSCKIKTRPKPKSFNVGNNIKSDFIVVFRIDHCTVTSQKKKNNEIWQLSRVCSHGSHGLVKFSAPVKSVLLKLRSLVVTKSHKRRVFRSFSHSYNSFSLLSLNVEWKKVLTPYKQTRGKCQKKYILYWLFLI